MEKKKAYLLAFQRATNYGAVLQIFALKAFLEQRNIEVKVIDYIPQWMQVSLKNQPSILSYFKRRIMNFMFENFFKKLNFTKRRYYDLESLSKSLPFADFYFVGSDQVWNEKIIKQDPTYFLSFAPKNAVKIGYAISMGNNMLSDVFLNTVKSNIRSFNYISAREKFVSDFVEKQQFGKDVPVLLDPTLLLGQSDYDNLLSMNGFNEDYIAVYPCMRDERLYELALYLKKVTGLKLINLGYHFKGPDKHEYLSGPINWINRIKYSRYFITNSFHGTAFAITYKKLFFAVPTNKSNQLGRNARFTELLDSVSLTDRLINNKLDIDRLIDREIDYDNVHTLLVERRRES